MSLDLGIQRVFRDIRDRELVSRGDHVAVAFSGGPDSLCLLQLLTRLRAALDLEVTALHVDHGLRPEAAAEAERARDLADGLEVPFELLHADLDPDAPGNTQERARLARRALLEQAADEAGCGPLAVAHTADDQAETVLMRAVRGAGPRGLAAMDWREGRVIRPLLATTRHQVEAHLASLHLRPVRDPTNAQDKYLRNRIRSRVMPLLLQENPNAVQALCRMAEICREEDSALERLSLAELERASLPDGGLDTARLAALPAAVLPRVLLLAHHRARGDTRRLERKHVQAMVDLVRREEGGTRAVDLPGVRLERRYSSLEWVERQGRGEAADPPPPPPPLPVPGPGDYPLPDGGTIHLRPGPAVDAPPRAHRLDPAAAGFPMEIRAPAPGDRLETAPGMHRKVARLLQDAKIPRNMRQAVPLLFYRKQLVLVVGVRAACGASAPQGAEALVVWRS